MAKFSTGLRTSMLDATGAKSALTGGKLMIYSGAVPADADAAVTGTLLATLTDNGGAGGLNFDTPVAGVLNKNLTQVWKTNSITASGTASYFRFVAAADTGAVSTTAPRVQGTIGLVGADMNVSDTFFTASQPWTLSYFVLALPTL